MPCCRTLPPMTPGLQHPPTVVQVGAGSRSPGAQLRGVWPLLAPPPQPDHGGASSQPSLSWSLGPGPEGTPSAFPAPVPGPASEPAEPGQASLKPCFGSGEDGLCPWHVPLPSHQQTSRHSSLLSPTCEHPPVHTRAPPAGRNLLAPGTGASRNLPPALLWSRARAAGPGGSPQEEAAACPQPALCGHQAGLRLRGAPCPGGELDPWPPPGRGRGGWPG